MGPAQLSHLAFRLVLKLRLV